MQKRLRQLAASDYLIVWLCLIYFALTAPFITGFASINNFNTVTAYMLPLIPAAVGVTVVLIAGGIDLSITSIIAMASVVGASCVSLDQGWLPPSAGTIPLGVAAMILLGTLAGGLNGCLVVLCRLPAFMATLITMILLGGVAVWLTQSQRIGGFPSSFLMLGQNLLLSGALVITLVGITHVLLQRTCYGKWLHAIGHNQNAALISGIPVQKITWIAYLISGLMAGASALLFTASLETGNPEMAKENLLDIIGAAVIGGASLYGGRGNVISTVFGVLFLALVDNSLNLMEMSYFTIMMAKGGVILAAALLDSIRNKWRSAA